MKQRTLRQDLLRRLLVPLLLIVAMTGVIGVYGAQQLINRTFDRWLIDAARSIAEQVRFEQGLAQIDLGGDALAILAYDVIDNIWFSVRQGERNVVGHPQLVAHGQPVERYDDGVIYQGQFHGKAVRIAVVTLNAGGEQTQVLVAETLLKRQGVRADLALMFVPMAILLLAAAGAILFALRLSIRPLERIAARWNEQSHHSLQALPLHEVPRELQPFAGALNDLLARIHQLLQRERRFAANAAHQIRTPLAGLQLGLSRAAAATDLQQARQVIGELQGKTRDTSRLLQQLMALGRLDPENAFDLQREPVDLTKLAHDVGSLFMDAALARHMDLELIEPESAVVAHCQADLISEALANLVDNALQYTPAGGKVSIRVLQSPAGFEVQDNGPGVPAAEREAVLERFIRGQSAVGEGSGLGLAIVREIAQLHGASLQLDDAPGGGLLVRLVLG